MKELRQMSAEARVLTLLGPGGIGKTRLALEFVRSIELSYPDGAWMVQLSSLERKSDLWPTIATTLAIDPVPGAERRIQVLNRLRDARAILLMDNCEHVLDQISAIVVELGSMCSELTIVNTSRHTLGMPGEVLYKVPALSAATGQDPAQSTVVRLFVERARQTNNRFDPTPAELLDIQKICESLENIPLAIEIAAEQMRRFSLDQIVKDAATPLDLWPSKAQRRSGRQQTLRRALEWSYDLLDPPSRQVLQRLSVFSGPFYEEQGLAVCAGDMDDEFEVLENEHADELLPPDAEKSWKGAPTRHAAMREVVAAKMCGRWRNGVPLKLSPDTPDPKPEVSLTKFDYGIEPKCPYGAHTRRCNPRGGAIVQRVANNTRRLVRRGMPYGPAYDASAPKDVKRGLLGNFLCANLGAQFEAVMCDWLNLGLQDPMNTGSNDPLLGVNEPAQSWFEIPLKSGKAVRLEGLPRFINTKRGAYTFLPSVPAIRYLASLNG